MVIHRLGSGLNMVLLILKESLRSFRKNSNINTAASLAYYGFFAFIPLFFIALSILSVQPISQQHLIEAIERIAGQVFPQFGKVITADLNDLAKHRDVVGLFGFVALFWSITPLINGTRNAFAIIFKVRKKTSFLKSLALDIAALSAIILLFAGLLVSELYYEGLEKSGLIKNSLAFSVIDYVVPFIVSFVAILFFYFIFSPLRTKILHVVAISLLASLFWIAMKEFFVGFIFMSPYYGFAFGSLKAIFTVIIWSYCSFCILLFGAEVMANMRNRELIILKKIFFKRPLSKRMREDIIGGLGRPYCKEEIVYSKGDEAKSIFYVLSGKVGIYGDGEEKTIREEGSFFGELSMLLEEPRAGSAQAMTDDTFLVAISRDNFEAIMQEHPMVVFDILKDMALHMKGRP